MSAVIGNNYLNHHHNYHHVSTHVLKYTLHRVCFGLKQQQQQQQQQQFQLVIDAAITLISSVVCVHLIVQFELLKQSVH